VAGAVLLLGAAGRDVLGELDTREQSSGDPAPAAGAERRAGS